MPPPSRDHPPLNLMSCSTVLVSNGIFFVHCISYKALCLLRHTFYSEQPK